MRLGLLLFLASVTAAAEELTVTSGSEVSFSAKTTFHDFSGRTSRLAGHLRLEAGRVRAGRVAVTTASLDTGEPDRDRSMLGQKYLDSEHHAELVFEASSFDGPDIVRGQGGTGTLHGDIIIRGQHKTLAIPVNYEWEGASLVVTGATPLDIRDFGMSPPTVAVIQRMDAEVIVKFHIRFVGSARP